MSITFQQNIYTYQHFTPNVPQSNVPYQFAVQQMTVGPTMAFRNQPYTLDGKGLSCNKRKSETSNRKQLNSLATLPTYFNDDRTNCGAVQQIRIDQMNHKIEQQENETVSFPTRDNGTTPHPRLCLPIISASDNFAENVMSEESDLGYYSFCDISEVRFDDIPTEGEDSKANFSKIIDEVLDSLDAENSCDNRVYLDKVNSSNTFPINTMSYPSCSYQNIIPNFPTQTQLQQQYACTSFQEQPEYSCTLCSQTFRTDLELATHTRNHKNSRPHKCSYCAKSFTQKSTLRTHERTHTGERPYCCQFCARAFSDYSTFKKHLRTHTGEKPYSCDVCEKSFTQSGNMIRHREIHFKHLKNV